jgi:hypothetical protein
MEINLFNITITIERNDDTWQKRLIKKATALGENEGYGLNSGNDFARKIERIKAIRLVRHPYPPDSDYYYDRTINDKGMSTLYAAKQFVEDYWLDE